jgi:hypothetical protein
MDDKRNTMKRISIMTIAAVLAFAAYAAAQTTAVTASSRPLADVAKDEEARRKSVRNPAKVYTNDNLRTVGVSGVAAPPVAAPTAATGNTTPSNATPAAPATTAAAAAASGGKQDQSYWQSRIKDARDQVQRSQLFADSLQTRINSLWTDFVNRDNPIEKAKLEQDRNTALAELEKVKKEITDQQKKITAIEDEARRAGVPPGWLRPGA